MDVLRDNAIHILEQYPTVSSERRLHKTPYRTKSTIKLTVIIELKQR